MLLYGSAVAKKGSRSMKSRNGREGGMPGSIPDRNGDGVAGELSRCNELPNVFLENFERARWLDLLYKNFL